MQDVAGKMRHNDKTIACKHLSAELWAPRTGVLGQVGSLPPQDTFNGGVAQG